ncbi:hypothetical protein [Arenimonas sp. GDDSR-1]|uniref:hypothetical protein n=1 Tax=Arenimonas sp. GDDSR-1 TaxID=2950125 RepID=UPI0026316B49|nr:hypothetical protein [Arenimonas sp. GDDSR-1]
MALSLKNTAISLALSGLMLFAGYLGGEAPAKAAAAGFTSIPVKASVQSNAAAGKSQAAKKAKRAFSSPYFSFGKSNLPTGAR